jgi:hypothetical protein
MFQVRRGTLEPELWLLMTVAFLAELAPSQAVQDREVRLAMRSSSDKGHPSFMT